MIFSIETKRQYPKSFLKVLKRIIRDTVLKNIDFMKISAYTVELSILFDRRIDCYQAIRQALKSFKILSETGCIDILLPSNIYLVGTDLRLAAIVSAMEYGALDLKPYPLIRNSLKNIEKNIDKHYRRYLRFGW